MKKMKKLLLSVFAGLTAFSMLAGCSQQAPSGGQSQSSPSSSDDSSSSQSRTSSASESSSAPAPESAAPESAAPSEGDSVLTGPESGGTLVVYFSASGNTRAVAETIADAAGAELYELTPAEPYTDADLDWTVTDSRVNTEHNDPAHRTAIAGEKDFSAYDTIFLGYPLWWREAPSIVWNLIETADFSGKTIIPFCTSTSDGIEGSVETLKGMAPAADWLEGHRFGESLDEASVTEWVNGLGLESGGTDEVSEPAAPAEAAGT